MPTSIDTETSPALDGQGALAHASALLPSPDRSVGRGMPLPGARGPASAALLDFLTGSGSTSVDQVSRAVAVALRCTPDLLRDDDLQLALFCSYTLHYGGIAGVSDDWEWDLDLLAIRRRLEQAFEGALRAAVHAPAPEIAADSLSTALFTMTDGGGEAELAAYVGRQATDAQLHEFLILRSVYTLMQADPHSWGIPRLQGAAKAALVEIQSDEYGGGRPQWMRSSAFGRALKHLGLDDEYGRYVDRVPAISLASVNMMTLFGLHRRLRGSIVGHLAAFELSAAAPSRLFGDGFRRNGYGTEVTEYFDENVEPDSIHARIAARDLAESLVDAEPELLDDVLFGASACLAMERWLAEAALTGWEERGTALRTG
jgi:hypothetical protein